ADMEGGSWNSENVIVFGSGGSIYRVLAAGGQQSAILTPGDNPKDVKLEAPHFLPDGRHYLYLRRSAKPSESAVFVGAIDSKDSTRLFTAESNLAYAAPGYILFHREGTLYAQPFNAKSASLSGEAVRVADRVPFGAGGAASFAASQNGILAYRSSPDT